jgi:fluoride ion exporter CrcB/FEX
MSLGLILLLGAAGACGALARYGVAEWLARRYRTHFPLAPSYIVSG